MKLSDVCNKITDGSHNPPKGVSISEYIMLSSKNIFDDSITFDEPRYLTEEEFNAENNRTNISEDDLLMTIVGTVGRVAIVPHDFPKTCLQRSVAVLKIDKSKALSRYMMYQLQSKRAAFETEAHGVAQKGIYLKQLSDTTVVCPPLETQRQIAANLDKVTHTIDLCNAILEKLDLLVKARFVEMFGDPIVNPYGLPVSSLGELSELITKGASPNWQGFSYTNDNTQTLFVTSENVREGFIDLSNPKYIENGFNDKQKRSMLRSGDFLINIVGASIGRAAQYTFDYKANINQATALVRISNKQINAKYLLIYLNSEKAQLMYNEMKSDTGRANLSLQDINNLLILLPPIEEQEQFAAFVEQTDKSKLAVKQVLEKAETLKKALMQEYFG